MPHTAIKRPAEHKVLTGRDFLKSHADLQRSALMLAVLAGTFSSIFMLIQWLIFAYMAEKIIVDKVDFTSLRSLLILFVVAVIARTLLTRLQSSYSQSASLNIRDNIRKVMLRYWRTASPIGLKQTSVGASAARWIEEVEAMDGYFSRYWPQQMLALISPLLILAVVAYLNWLCAILLLVSAPLIPLFMVLVGMGAEKLNQKYSSVRQRLAGHFLDRVANLSSIKILGADEEVFEEVTYYSTQYRKVIMKTLKLAFLSSTVLEFFTSVAIASLAIYIGFSLYGAITWGPAESLSLFTGLVILILAPEFFQPLRSLSQYYHDRATALGAANNLVHLLNTGKGDIQASTTNSKPTNSKHAKSQKTSIHASQLVLAYQAQDALTKPISFAANTGDIVVITGHSGAGKSTLLNTIAGYLAVSSGELDIAPNSNIPMAYLPQLAWIKNDTIYNNLKVLAPNANEADMLSVIQTLGLDQELAINHTGLNTKIGEHGQGLSGGQMQRIALARVLLNPCPIVLLDEPTAKLDIASKQFIVKALNLLQENAILVIATHDPALIAMATIHLDLDLLAGANDAVLV